MDGKDCGSPKIPREQGCCEAGWMCLMHMDEVPRPPLAEKGGEHHSGESQV